MSAENPSGNTAQRDYAPSPTVEAKTPDTGAHATAIVQESLPVPRTDRWKAAADVVRIRPFSLAVPLAEVGLAFDRGETERLRLPLFEGEEVWIDILSHQSMGDSTGVLVGRALHAPESHVVLSYVENAMSGTLQLPAQRRAFQIRSDSTGNVLLVELNPDAGADCVTVATLHSDPR